MSANRTRRPLGRTLPRKAIRRSMTVLIGVVFACGLLLVPGPSAIAATCSVKNTRTGHVHLTLQRAVDLARSGDTLTIRGTCGHAGIRLKALKLIGIPTAASPQPTLDGEGTHGVLFIKRSEVVIAGLKITNGYRNVGSGIYLLYGTLTLTGRTIVTGNATPRSNITAQPGGGIYNGGGTLRLRRSTLVTDNQADVGGGIYNDHDSTLVLGDEAEVSENHARVGGGIYNSWGTVILKGAASVAANSAQRKGGGIFVFHGVGTSPVYVCSDAVRISPNDPDDPPEALSCL